MTYIEGCERAFDYFYRSEGINGIAKALDGKNVWIFYPGKADEITIGGIGICMDKTTGEISDFILPSLENFAILETAVPLDVPNQFKGDQLYG